MSFTSSATFGERYAFSAQRAGCRIKGFYVQVQQSFSANAEVYLAAAAVNQQANAYELAAMLFNYFHNLFNAAAGCYDIFNNQYAGACRNLEATTQSHFAVFTLGEDSTGAQSLANLKAILAEAGLSMNNVVKTVIFLADINDFAAVNAEYAKAFAEPFPARSCVQVAAIPKGAKLEIECIAVRD